MNTWAVKTNLEMEASLQTVDTYYLMVEEEFGKVTWGAIFYKRHSCITKLMILLLRVFFGSIPVFV